MAEEVCSLKSVSGRWVLASTILTSGVSFLAGSAVSIALPAIQSGFAASLSGLQWVVNANLLSLSVFILIGGALGDKYGRKSVLIFGLILFSVAAFFSALAPTIEILIILQALQGFGSALMVPQSLAIINDCFIEGERGRAIGLWAGISGGVALLGPVLGGALIGLFFMASRILTDGGSRFDCRGDNYKGYPTEA